MIRSFIKDKLENESFSVNIACKEKT